MQNGVRTSSVTALAVASTGGRTSRSTIRLRQEGFASTIRPTPLLRQALNEDQFATLYAPFEPVIPAALLFGIPE